MDELMLDRSLLSARKKKQCAMTKQVSFGNTLAKIAAAHILLSFSVTKTLGDTGACYFHSFSVNLVLFPRGSSLTLISIHPGIKSIGNVSSWNLSIALRIQENGFTREWGDKSMVASHSFFFGTFCFPWTESWHHLLTKVFRKTVFFHLKLF